jgi:uncharacterized protein YeaO (DUF488 family)
MLDNIQIKRIYEKPAIADGYRVLVDRLWPRGIKKETAMLDEWNKEIAPSTELRKWFDHKEERFAEFGKRYTEELQLQEMELDRLRKIAKTKKISLLYAAKNPKINHALVLLTVLTQKQGTKK